MVCFWPIAVYWDEQQPKADIGKWRVLAGTGSVPSGNTFSASKHEELRTRLGSDGVVGRLTIPLLLER
jgi:hypothetical protein